MPPDPELIRSVATIIRENVRLQADLKTLFLILDMSEKNHQAIEQWKELFLQAREMPAYREQVGAFEPSLQRLEKAADDNEVIAVLQQFPQAKFPN